MEDWRRYRHPKVYRERLDVTKPRAARRSFSWRTLRRFIVFLVIIGAVGWVIWALFWSPKFTIHQVTITGESTSPLEEVAKTYQSKRLLFVRENQVLAAFQSSDPSVTRTILTKGFPDQLKIAVARRHPALLWQSGDAKWAIDADGYAFQPDANTSTDGLIPIVDTKSVAIKSGAQLVSPAFVDFMTSAFTELPNHLGGKILRAEVDETTFQVRFVTEWNWTLLMDTTRPLKGQLPNLDLVLKEHKADIHEYLDMRLSGWAYIK